MLKKIEHIGIAVQNLEEANEVFTKLLGSRNYKTETVEREGVKTSFFKIGESKIELLESMMAGNAISKFIERKGQGIHHIALAVDNIEIEMKRLAAEGFQLLNSQPLEGADNQLVCFIHPKSCNGILVELCQDRRKNQ